MIHQLSQTQATELDSFWGDFKFYRAAEQKQRFQFQTNETTLKERCIGEW